MTLSRCEVEIVFPSARCAGRIHLHHCRPDKAYIIRGRSDSEFTYLLPSVQRQRPAPPLIIYPSPSNGNLTQKAPIQHLSTLPAAKDDGDVSVTQRR